MDAKCVFHFIGFLNYRKIIFNLGRTKFLFNQKSTILINLIIESSYKKSWNGIFNASSKKGCKISYINNPIQRI